MKNVAAGVSLRRQRLESLGRQAAGFEIQVKGKEGL
jgi:hypothetical protein